MTLFVITGTSGVGKSFLEQVLKNQYGFFPIPKCTDRQPRPTEIGTSDINFMSREEFENKRNQFFFTLEYVGNNYGWLQSDLDLHTDTNLTMAITIEAMVRMIDLKIKMIPILLHADSTNLSLLEKRASQRENLDKLEGKELDEAKIKIAHRMQLAKDEIENAEQYISKITNYGGQVFTIKDDRTLFDEVVPWIMNIINN